MARNLIIACDGTDNQFGRENTNVVRLVQALDRRESQQLIYYDPGVGTLPEPGVVTAAGKKLSMIGGLAFGVGLGWKVREAYRFLMEHWQPGDRVYLYGFSRGAYSVRVIASFLHMLGLLPSGAENLLPYAFRLLSSARHRLKGHEAQKERFWQLCDQFRETFARDIPAHEDKRFPIHFLGVWDTVSSTGWIWDPVHFPYTRRNPSVSIVRHAVSIDERRWFFRQNLFQRSAGQDLQQLWFPGVHCDVGGGYPIDRTHTLWQAPYRWMLEESKRAGVFVDSAKEQQVWTRSDEVERPWLGRQHESLTWKWWPAELFPKLQYRTRWHRRVPDIGLGRRRRIKDDAVPHPSTLLRMNDPNLVPPYSPPNAPPSWRQLAKDIQSFET